MFKRHFCPYTLPWLASTREGLSSSFHFRPLDRRRTAKAATSTPRRRSSSADQTSPAAELPRRPPSAPARGKRPWRASTFPSRTRRRKLGFSWTSFRGTPLTSSTSSRPSRLLSTSGSSLRFDFSFLISRFEFVNFCDWVLDSMELTLFGEYLSRVC